MLLALVVGALFGLVPACDNNSAEQGEGNQKTKKQEVEEEEGGEEADEVSNEGQDEKKENSEGEQAVEEAEEVLLSPGDADEKAPETFTARFETTAGDFRVKFHREWAPKGVDRAYNLIKIGYFEDIAFFRVIDGFMAQFGLHGNPKVNEAWSGESIKDDSVEKSNKRGRVTFAQKRSPNSRKTQMFINYTANSSLDKQGFAPVGEVVGDGMEVVDELYKGYGEGAPRGDGPSQGKIKQKGNSYLKENFPKLDYIEKVELVEE